MKHVTTIEQSRMLADVLPKESADCAWVCSCEPYYLSTKEYKEWLNELDGPSPSWLIPAWSLGALLNLIPYPMLGQATNEPNKGKWYVHALVNPDGDITDYVTDVYDNPIDACIDAIKELNKPKEGGEDEI